MTLLLVDGTNVVMRCASVTDFSPEEAVSAALNIVRRAVETIGAKYLIVAFDSPASIRRVVYPQYKADRTTKTAPWIEAALASFTAAGIYCTSSEGYEADDCIAAFVSRVRGREPIAILSSDSDLLVLTREDVAVWRFDKKGRNGLVKWTPAMVCEKYGIPTPGHLTLYKALVGEPGDNVPGVPQIGPVRARKHIAEFGDFPTMRKLGVLGEHVDWCEKAMTLLSLYDFAVVPQIERELVRVDRLTRKVA